jgi:choloylglycine hydrolase
MTFSYRLLAAVVFTVSGSCLVGHHLLACTGITLKARDGTVMFGRTLEWGPFDLKSRLIVVPRGHKFTSKTPDGSPGQSWITKYGVVGVDGVGKDIVIDGMNEKGLQVGLFYHPGIAEYQKYDPTRASESLAPTDVGTYLLTTCDSVEQAREAVEKKAKSYRWSKNPSGP